MEYLPHIVGVIFGLLVVMVLLSVLDSALHRLSRVDLIVLAEQQAHRRDPIFDSLAQKATTVQLHLRLGAQFTIIVVAILITYTYISLEQRFALLWSFLCTGAVVIIFRQILPSLLAQARPEQILVRLIPVLKAFLILTKPLASPVLSSLEFARKTEKEGHETEPNEASEKEIQAYLDVGEEAGILEEDDSELIQSVVEFGDTIVEEVMTPRTEIVGLPDSSTVRQMRDLMDKEKHSRIPVYRNQIDNIVGMVHVRHILGHCEEGKYDTPVSNFLIPVPFVPETKNVGDLLKEMQSSGAQMAIVVDEYGGVSGLVTMEDLLEVIVGDIRDEDEIREEDIICDEMGNYRLPGDLDLDRFEEVFGELEENGRCATVSGLLIQYLGRVPESGERFGYRDFSVEVLESDGKRIVDLRLARRGQDVNPTEDAQP